MILGVWDGGGYIEGCGGWKRCLDFGKGDIVMLDGYIFDGIFFWCYGFIGGERDLSNWWIMKRILIVYGDRVWIVFWLNDI